MRPPTSRANYSKVKTCGAMPLLAKPAQTDTRPLGGTGYLKSVG